jgi:hypothetical protein
MLFKSIINRIKGKKDTRKLVLEVVDALKIDEYQKELYRQAVEMLNDEEIDGLYQNLLETMKKFERAEAVAKFTTQAGDLSGIRRKEFEARVREEHSASILIDNI